MQDSATGSRTQLTFRWDRDKARANQRKHKISFEEAKTLFNDPHLLTYPDDEHSVTEKRYVSIGVSARGRMLLVVHSEHWETDDTLTIRIISCRRATSREQYEYEKNHE